MSESSLLSIHGVAQPPWRFWYLLTTSVFMIYVFAIESSLFVHVVPDFPKSASQNADPM
jgi:hypothetical protein